MLAAAAALSSCGGGASGSGQLVGIVAPDGVLRELGEACSGGEPFDYVHATASWKVEDAGSGKVIASGELPEGKAIALLNHDPGVDRVPTYCRFEIHADVVAGKRYRMVLGGGDPRPFGVNGGRATVVLE